ncbi:hypothetical protein F2Q69_00015891 [Brassica cretica]|uniref:Replication factor A C-terminal domain-containing protein n=1 Tax=Brassica cretica TaxID=69181 RepID=A0A8S9QRD6_BRACR|nr:hypothetical protein F2Q69_00015891 [Brassica cretica]
MAMKQNGKAPVSSDSEERVMLFKDVSLGPHAAHLRFRLIHFWEARNPIKKTLIGLEMLLIDEQVSRFFKNSFDTLRSIFTENFKRFIPPGRIKKYWPEMKQGSVYQLDDFYGSKNKPVYRVADHSATVSFTWNSEMSVLHEVPISFDEDRFRFHSYEDFEANCDLKGDLYVGNGQTFIGLPILDEVEIETSRHIMVHVQSHDGPVMKLYLWDQAATDFCKKFNSCENTPTVLLVTAVNTKLLGGTLALTSMSSTRVFMDYDVQPTKDYFTWYVSQTSTSISQAWFNPEIAKQVSAEVVTKRETQTIADIFSYMTQESAKCTATIDDVVHGSAWYYIACRFYTLLHDAFFECTATIDDVVHGSAWYYIACSACHSKATKGATSLICTNTRCGKVNTTGVAQYYAKISVYDNSEQAFFVLLGDAGRELTGRHASELVNNLRQTHKFCVKVTEHNFSGNTRAITVTKILSLDTPPPTEASVGNNIAATSEETMQTGNKVFEPSKSRGDSANEESKRTSASADPEKSKRPRCEK